MFIMQDTWWSSWLGQWDFGVTGILHLFNPSDNTMAIVLTLPVKQ